MTDPAFPSASPAAPAFCYLSAPALSARSQLPRQALSFPTALADLLASAREPDDVGVCRVENLDPSLVAERGTDRTDFDPWLGRQDSRPLLVSELNW